MKKIFLITLVFFPFTTSCTKRNFFYLNSTQHNSESMYNFTHIPKEIVHEIILQGAASDPVGAIQLARKLRETIKKFKKFLSNDKINGYTLFTLEILILIKALENQNWSGAYQLVTLCKKDQTFRKLFPKSTKFWNWLEPFVQKQPEAINPAIDQQLNFLVSIMGFMPQKLSSRVIFPLAKEYVKLHLEYQKQLSEEELINYNWKNDFENIFASYNPNLLKLFKNKEFCTYLCCPKKLIGPSGLLRVNGHREYHYIAEAALKGKLKFLQVLCKFAKTVDIDSFINCLLPIHAAAAHLNKEIITYLLKHKKIDINCRLADSHSTALHFALNTNFNVFTIPIEATENKRLEYVKFLVENGADLWAQEGKFENRTAYDVAIKKGFTQIAAYLQEKMNLVAFDILRLYLEKNISAKQMIACYCKEFKHLKSGQSLKPEVDYNQLLLKLDELKKTNTYTLILLQKAYGREKKDSPTHKGEITCPYKTELNE